VLVSVGTVEGDLITTHAPAEGAKLEKRHLVLIVKPRILVHREISR
jgi:hypothetical protein